jgi:hypothetical protein
LREISTRAATDELMGFQTEGEGRRFWCAERERERTKVIPETFCARNVEAATCRVSCRIGSADYACVGGGGALKPGESSEIRDVGEG